MKKQTLITNYQNKIDLCNDIIAELTEQKRPLLKASTAAEMQDLTDIVRKENETRAMRQCFVEFIDNLKELDD